MTAVAYGEKGVPYDSSDRSEMLVQRGMVAYKVT